VFRECAGSVQRYEQERCRPLFDKLAANGIWQTPTITMYRGVADAFAGKSLPHGEYASNRTLELHALTLKSVRGATVDEKLIATIRTLSQTSLTAIRDMLPRGNVFLTGCDGGVPGFCLHDELEALTEAGLSPLQALQAATINPARMLERERAQGSVEVGKQASLVLLNANPLADIRNARQIAAVIVKGRWLSKEDINQIVAARRRSTR
jgi:imidazolonepropionase-like amidohydrolase